MSVGGCSNADTLRLASTVFARLAGGRADALSDLDAINFEGDAALGRKVAQGTSRLRSEHGDGRTISECLIRVSGWYSDRHRRYSPISSALASGAKSCGSIAPVSRIVVPICSR